MTGSVLSCTGQSLSLTLGSLQPGPQRCAGPLGTHFPGFFHGASSELQAAPGCSIRGLGRRVPERQTETQALLSGCHVAVQTPAPPLAQSSLSTDHPSEM